MNSRGMRYRLAALLAAVAVAAAGSQGCAKRLKSRGGAAAASWVKVEPRGQGFSVLMPGEPEVISRPMPTRDGQSAQFRNYAVDAGGVAYEVTHIGGLPADLMQRPEAVDFLLARITDNVITTLERAGKGEVKILRQSDISLGGHRGREYEIGNDAVQSSVRVFVAGQSYYGVGFTGPRSKTASVNAEKYFGSFALKADAHDSD